MINRLKNIMSTALVVLMTAFQSYAQEPTVINVDMLGNTLSELSLYEVIDGEISKIATSKVINDKLAFKFFPSSPGFYAIGSPAANSFSMYHTFYVKGNDVINLRSENNVYSVVGKVSKETRDIENINVLFSTMKQYAGLNNTIHFTDVFVELTRVSDLAKTMKPTSKDKEFLKTYELYKEYYITMLALSYKYKPKTVGKHPKPEDFPTLYTSIAHAKFLSEDILQFPFGNRMLGSLILDAASAMQGKVKITKDNRRQVNVNLIPSDVIKGQYITNEIQSVNSYDEYAKLMAEFGHYITLPTQKDRVEKKLVTLANSVPGSPFIDFTYQNLNGENISKTDFKGKIVVLDFWATWCGPCKQEEPYFEKLAEEFQGKDVVFVAISTDRDKAAWDKYVKAKEGHFKGIHLHAGPANALSVAYKITGIPRYMMLDKSGNIITINAPRPSSENMKKMILENL